MELPTSPVTRQRLVATGCDDRELDRLVMSGQLAAPYRGVLLDAQRGLTLPTRALAALQSQSPGALLGHETAAVILGLRWCPREWSDPGALVHVIVPREDQHRHRAGLRLHRALVPESDVVIVSGMRCASPARTLVDLARRHDLPRHLVVSLMDGARRAGKCGEADLLRAVTSAAGQRYAARARSWIALSCDGVDSPPETDLRLILIDAGFDVEPDIRLHDEDGMVLARGDLGSRRLLLWGEYDGYDAHAGRATFRSDRVGDRWLERRGWHVMRFVDDDLRQRARTVREWEAAARAAPARIAAMDPHRSPEVADAQRLLGLLR